MRKRLLVPIVVLAVAAGVLAGTSTPHASTTPIKTSSYVKVTSDHTWKFVSTYFESNVKMSIYRKCDPAADNMMYVTVSPYADALASGISVVPSKQCQK